MREQHEEGVLDPAELLAVAGDIGQTSSSTAGFDDCPSSMFTSPTWLLTGLNIQVHGLID